MNIACVDTHIIIWGIKQYAEPGQEEMIPRAKALLKELDENNAIVMIPTIVLAELLSNIPTNEQSGFINALEENFMIVPFDIQATLHYADIWHKKNGIRKDEPICTRDHLKADIMIVASAMARSSKVLYSNDHHVIKAAENNIKCSKIPEISQQLDLGL